MAAAPTHAWRALGQLRAPEAVAPLLDLLKVLKDDDWIAAELPAVLGLIGPGAIPQLAEFLADLSDASQSLMTAVRSLAEIGTRNSTSRDECIAVLVHQLERGDADDPTINGFLISSLLDLEAVEAIDEIRQAFQKQAVDLSIAGDVEDVEMELGLRTGRSTPRPLYHRFMEDTMPRLADGDPGATPDRNVGASSMHRKVGRNDPCPCGSGKKYKKCCLH